MIAVTREMRRRRRDEECEERMWNRTEEELILLEKREGNKDSSLLFERVTGAPKSSLIYRKIILELKKRKNISSSLKSRTISLLLLHLDTWTCIERQMNFQEFCRVTLWVLMSNLTHDGWTERQHLLHSNYGRNRNGLLQKTIRFLSFWISPLLLLPEKKPNPVVRIMILDEWSFNSIHSESCPDWPEVFQPLWYIQF